MSRTIKIAIALSLAGIMAFTVILASLFGLGGVVSARQQMCQQIDSSGVGITVQAANVSLNSANLTVKGGPMQPAQAKNAAEIIGIGVNRRLPSRAWKVLLVASTVESTLLNLPYGDSDSLGLFQMRPSVGPYYWGTPEQILDTNYAINRMYKELEKTVGWQQMSIGDAAQAIEGSAFPERYALWVHEAEATVAAAVTNSQQSTGVSTVAADWTCQGPNLRIATLNVRGSSHEAHGPERVRQLAGMVQLNNLDVVGLQELQSNQRQALVDELSGQYGIYPSSPHNVHHSVENSIIWNQARLTKLDAGISTGYRYFNGSPLHIPWVKLKDNYSQTVFIVQNTHDPADGRHGQSARWREANAHQHLADAKVWLKQGLPVFLTGDFNSTFDIRFGGPTSDSYLIGHDKSRLPYCIMTASGDMLNAYDAMEGKTGCKTTDAQANADRQVKGRIIDHVYVSKGVDVVNWRWLETGSASDHDVLYIDVSFVSGGDGKWVLPLEPGSYTLTDPYRPYPNGHNGLDFAGACGSPVQADSGGRIVRAGYDSGWGNFIVIQHAPRLWSLFGHMTGFAPGIGVGQTVSTGQLIGYEGSTGNSTGCHVHVTIATDLDWAMQGRAVGGKGSVDPAAFYRSKGLRP
ncbi:MAG TPA: peptidoglycan DD-metalloendopeptidase family protein [Candidatus Saccharimonadales bacterium]|nr:peptidoglycan DD-metalloendopeptidase family protein [Candidatus Saccharimonadales bacterium]